MGKTKNIKKNPHLLIRAFIITIHLTAMDLHVLLFNIEASQIQVDLLTYNTVYTAGLNSYFCCVHPPQPSKCRIEEESLVTFLHVSPAVTISLKGLKLQ